MRRPISDGSLPVKVFECTLNADTNDVDGVVCVNRSDGNGPDNPFAYNSKLVRNGSSKPSSVGIDPTKLGFSTNSSRSKDVKRPSSVGMVPVSVSKAKDMCKTCNLESIPKCVGILPEMAWP